MEEIDCVADGGELHGDVLEAVVSHVSVLDLLPASLVSKAWRGAVLSSLRHSPRRVPWLVVHHINTRTRATVTSPEMAAITYVYDPISRAWASFPGSQKPPASETLANEALHGAYPGALLYALNLRSLGVSVDPFGSTWRVTDAPRVWRTDPVVATVGSRVVVAGGACEFEDEERAVEVRSVGGGWQACESMPEVFGESSWAAWLSVATSDQRLYVLEKNTTAAKGGWASCFDPESGRWETTRKLRLPGAGDAVPVAIGYAKGVSRLVVVGVAGGRARGNPAAVTLWAVDGKTLEVQEEIGRMPSEMAAEVAADEKAVAFCCEWGFGYVYKKTVWSSTPKEFIAVEFGKVAGGGGGVSKNGWRCRWERVPSPPEILREGLVMQRVIIGCSLLGNGADMKTVVPPAGPPAGRRPK